MTMTVGVITKQFSFDSAHQLVGHQGKCANLHGHTYHVEVALRGHIENLPDRSDTGMVLDYSEVKDVVKPIIDQMDHALLCDEQQFKWMSNDKNHTIFGKTKLYLVGNRTTAENIAKHLIGRLHKVLPNLYYIKVQETENTSAVVFYEDWRNNRE